MKLIAFLVTLTITSQASYQGFVGTRTQQEQEEYVTRDFASTEENLYSYPTNPTNPVTEGIEAVAVSDLKHDDSKKDEEGTDETTTEIITVDHVLKKRSPDTDEDVEYYEDKINIDETFKQDPYPTIIEVEESETLTAASPSVVENLKSAPRQEEPDVEGSEQVWRPGDSGNIPYCIPLDKEERGLKQGLGWAAATAILIFAFSNTVIVGATLVISYILYQVVITALAVMAPGVAAVFVKFASLFSFF